VTACNTNCNQKRDGRNRLVANAAQAIVGNDRRRIDPRRRPRSIGEHWDSQRRSSEFGAGIEHIQGADEPIVQRRLVLFHKTSDPSIRRHRPKRPKAPDANGDRREQRPNAQRGEDERRTRGPVREDEREREYAGNGERSPDRSLEQDEAFPARSNSVNQLTDLLYLILHRTVNLRTLNLRTFEPLNRDLDLLD